MKIEDKSKTKSGTVCFLCENESCGYWTGRCEVPRFPLRSILHAKSELKMNKFFTPEKWESAYFASNQDVAVHMICK